MNVDKMDKMIHFDFVRCSNSECNAIMDFYTTTELNSFINKLPSVDSKVFNNVLWTCPKCGSYCALKIDEAAQSIQSAKATQASQSAELTDTNASSVTLDRRLVQLKKIQDNAYQVFQKKNTDYGDAFAKYGTIGVLMRIQDKIQRGLTITKNAVTLVNDESLRDTLLDLHNYAAMAVMLMDE